MKTSILLLVITYAPLKEAIPLLEPMNLENLVSTSAAQTQSESYTDNMVETKMPGALMELAGKMGSKAGSS